MSNQGVISIDINNLRHKAEEKIRENNCDPPVISVPRSAEETQQLIHELQVYQIELEMQNEELLQTQHELNTERENYFSLYELAPVGYVIVDHEGLILKTNLAATIILDRAWEDLLGEPIYQTIYPEDQDIFYICRRKLRNTSKLQVCELRMVKKNGTTFWASLACSTMQSESGVLSHLIMLSDITDRKNSDQALKESEEKYRQLFYGIKDSILVTDTNRNIIDCNQTLREFFGYSKEEIVGRQTTCLYSSKKEFQKVGKKLKDYFELDEKNFTYNINYKKKSGEIFPGETNAFFLENDKGETVGSIGMIRDITHRKMVEASLQKAKEELERKAIELEDTNTALKVLLKKRDQDNLELQENIYSNYELMLTPFLSKVKNRSNNRNQQNLLDIIETNLQEIVAPFAKNLASPMMSLTSSEIQIATMIKQGYSNKEIATILNSSKRTIDSHRQNIRKKLKLNNEKINLKTYLLNL